MSDESFEGLLSSVLGNDELMGKISSILESHASDKDASLPEVVEAISASIKKDGSDSQEKESKPEENTDAIAKKMPSFSRNTKLLSALKPYLNDKRAQMIDNLLKIEQIAEIMKLAR